MSVLMKISSLVILLVAGSPCYAHERQERGVATSPAVEKEKKDSVKSRSIVLDWNSVCQDLCSIGYGGAGCHNCKAHPKYVNQHHLHHPHAAQHPMDTKSQLHLCAALCMNGLGGNQCICNGSMTFQAGINATARNEICTASCEIDYKLAGCSFCAKTDAVTASTTPDWNHSICPILCRAGQGGSACNCDKPPFF